MTLLDKTRVMRSVHDLPALSSVVLDLISSFDRQNVDLDMLADKICRDQALAAKTLRLANSSFYGLSRKVSTVKQAILVLGIDSTRALAVASSVIDTFSKGEFGNVDVTGFWRHSIAVALGARNLAGYVNVNQDYAFIAALLHDIGRLVLASSFPEQYVEVIEHCERHGGMVGEAELQVLGIDHQQIGQLLAETWKFPSLIQRAIGQHHAVAAADMNNVPGVVHFADALVHTLDLGGSKYSAVPRLLDPVWDSLCLSQVDLLAVCSETEGQFEEACHLLM